MEISKFIFLIFLVCTWCVVAYSQEISSRESLPCIKQLLPCQPYLKGSSSPPTSCCVPLKQIIADDSQCLCTLFNDVAILKTFNVTKDDAINLAKSCGANDINVCHRDTAPSGSSSTPDTPSPNSNSSETAAPPKSSAAAAKYDHIMGSMPLFPILTIIVSAFF